jgi:hypothetical protein
VTSRKSPRDTAQLAKLVVDIATDEVADREPAPEKQRKNPAAVAFGRKGALRAGRLAPQKRGRASAPFGIAGLSGQSHHGPALTCTWFRAENLIGDLRSADLSGCCPSRQAPPIRL